MYDRTNNLCSIDGCFHSAESNSGFCIEHKEAVWVEPVKFNVWSGDEFVGTITKGTNWNVSVAKQNIRFGRLKNISDFINKHIDNFVSCYSGDEDQ